MAVSILSREVSDLCLGKPPLKSLPISATVADALAVLKTSDDSFISVWSCDHSPPAKFDGDDERDTCQCIGKLCMVDVICYLSKEENLSSPSRALKAPVSVLLQKASGLVKHVQPSSSLLEAIDLLINGAQNLVVPIKKINFQSRKRFHQTQTIHNGFEYCWITQEDVLRFLLSSIGIFSPIPALSIETLGIIDTEVLAVDYNSPASAAVDLISRSLTDQTSVAVLDNNGLLIGEISPSTLTSSDEMAAAAVATLSAINLMAYIDGGAPPEDLLRLVKMQLKQRNLEAILEITDDASPSLSDEDIPAASPRSGRYARSGSYSARMMRRAEAMVCFPASSLVAVMIQAIAHRVSYVWVVEDDYSLAGIVKFSDVLKVFREHVHGALDEEPDRF